MAVVVPEGILTNKNDARIRELIRRECIIKAVVRLPQDAFKMSEGAACTSILYLVKKKSNNLSNSEQGDIFFARAEYIGISPSGKPIGENDLLSIREHYYRFQQDQWEGIEMQSNDEGQVNIVRAEPTKKPELWLEPSVNRTSLLYDRLSYIIRSPVLIDRFSYVYFHPSYHSIVNELDQLSLNVANLESFCVSGYPARGRKPSEESIEGIPIIKVRNVTGQGINMDTDYAPNSDEIWAECARATLKQNDILITSTGEGTIGRVDVYPYEDGAIADGHVTICRLKPDVNLGYMVEFLRSEYGQIQMLRHVSGSLAKPSF